MWDPKFSTMTTRWQQSFKSGCNYLTHPPGMRMVMAACTALRMMLSIANIQWGLMWWFLRTLFTWKNITQGQKPELNQLHYVYSQIRWLMIDQHHIEWKRTIQLGLDFYSWWKQKIKSLICCKNSGWDKSENPHLHVNFTHFTQIFPYHSIKFKWMNNNVV